MVTHKHPDSRTCNGACSTRILCTETDKRETHVGLTYFEVKPTLVTQLETCRRETLALQGGEGALLALGRQGRELGSQRAPGWALLE